MVREFARDGFVLVRGVFARDAAAAMRAEGHAVLERLRTGPGRNGAWSTVGAADGPPAASELHHCHDLHLHSAVFTRALIDDGFTTILAALLGTDAVQLHHNKLFVKPPQRGAPFPMHQDWPFFPHRHDSPIAAIVHLDEATVDKGCVQAVPGSFRRGRLEHVGETDWHLDPDDGWVDRAVELPAEPGDVLFFNYLTVHGSGPNLSPDVRTTWLVQVRAAHDAPTVDRHRSPGQGTMLRGTNVDRPPTPTSFGAV